jgi:hypothetical protein
MDNLRRWQLNSDSPHSLQLAADARLSPTDYIDDQVWELMLGAGDSPALQLQTRYGGRVGLASLVPMWIHEGRLIYEAKAYAKPPYVTAFAPGYLRIQATLVSQLALQAEYWAMESHAIGARFTIANAHTSATKVRLDLFGYVASSGKEVPPRIITLDEKHHALLMVKFGSLHPVVIMEDASADLTEPVSPKIGKEFIIPARKKVVLRWVHAGLREPRESLALAQSWLKQDWDAHFERITQAAQTIPVIETGDKAQDAAIAFSYQQLVQAFLRPTANLPHASIVATRQPGRGFSPSGDGKDHNREWNGQSPTLMYLSALAMASIDPQMAQGLVRNYLAVQEKDGWIDWKPGLSGQRQGIMCLPILARLTWGVFQYTENDSFLAEVFPGLLKFFERWLGKDLDTDEDGLAEWQSENQTGYLFLPIFAASHSWGQGADIRVVEAPDMAAYLLSEAISLREIAYYLRKTEAEQILDKRIEALKISLENLWDKERLRYVYRDRDTHITTDSVTVLRDGQADEEHLPALKLSPANRLIMRVSGGVDHTPRMTLHLTGIDQDGKDVSETAQGSDFVWHLGRGVYTSRHVFSQIDRVYCEGLSRVYRVEVETLGTNRIDINALMPLWSVGIPKELIEPVVKLLTDPGHFWQQNGVTMCSAQDKDFDPANAKGVGSVWPFWQTLMGEGLIEAGNVTAAADLLKRVLAAQTAVLKQDKAFAEFYESSAPKGLGERGHVSGIVPLHLLMRVLGVRIVSSGKVWTGGPFVWDKPVTITQHGVTVQRTKTGTHVSFPSGYEVDVSGDVMQEIIDPNPVTMPPILPIETEPQSVSIEVQRDKDD